MVRNSGRGDRRGIAKAWIVLAGLVVIALGVVLVMPILARPVPGPSSPRAVCLHNLKRTGVAALMYAVDFEDHLPPAADWHGRITGWDARGELPGCPAAPWSRRPGYGAHVDVMGKHLAEIDAPGEQFLFFDGHGSLIIERHQFDGGEPCANYCYADGHVKLLKEPPPGFAVER